MKPINPKKFVASAVIFLFTNFSSPAMANVDFVPIEAPVSAQASVLAVKAPKIDTSAPRVICLQKSADATQSVQAGAKAIIRSIDFSPTLIRDLKYLPFTYGQDKVNIVNGSYGSIAGGYVCMASTDLQTGCINIQQANNELENRLKDLLASPQKYNVSAEFVNAQLAPKIVSDSVTGSNFMAMEAWDFRLVSMAKYNDVAINQMMANAYSSFKTYAQLMQNKCPNEPIVLHTSYWGTQYNNNARVTTTIQLLAAYLAGIDKIVFYANIASPDTQSITDAQVFVQQQDGKSVGDILANLLKQSESTNWSAGTCTIAAFGDGPAATMGAN